MLKDIDVNLDFELKMLPGDNSSKKEGQKSDKDEKCLSKDDEKMKYIGRFVNKLK